MFEKRAGLPAGWTDLFRWYTRDAQYWSSIDLKDYLIHMFDGGISC